VKRSSSASLNVKRASLATFATSFCVAAVSHYDKTRARKSIGQGLDELLVVIDGRHVIRVFKPDRSIGPEDFRHEFVTVVRRDHVILSTRDQTDGRN